MKKSQFGVFLAAGFMTLLFTGCTTENELLKQRAALAVRHYDKSQYKKAPERTLLLQDCIRLALANTLDRKVGEFFLTVSDPEGMKNVLEKLPGLQYRYGGAKEKVSSFARDGEDLSSLDLDFTFGFMDLALAYFNYRQDRNREWAGKQASLRVAQDLILEVTKAYVDHLIAKRSVEIIDAALNEKNISPDVLKKLRNARGIAPYKAFGLLRDYNELKQQRAEFEMKADNAASRLKALMGYAPSAAVNVESPVLDQVPVLTGFAAGKGKSVAANGREILCLPKLEMLERIALLNRPELALQDGKEGVSSIECAKVIFALFPQLRLFFHYNGHGDDFLYNRSWWDLGIAASVNLLNLPAGGVEFHAKYKRWKAEEAATYASSIAVLSQVRISHNALEKSAALLKASDEDSILCIESYKRERNGGKKFSDTVEMEAQLKLLKVRLRRLQDVGKFHLAAARLINVLGLDNLNADNLEACQELLIKAEEQAIKAGR